MQLWGEGWGMYPHPQPQCTPSAPQGLHPHLLQLLGFLGTLSSSCGTNVPSDPTERERDLSRPKSQVRGDIRAARAGGRDEGSQGPGAGAGCVRANTWEGQEQLVLLFLTTSTSTCPPLLPRSPAWSSHAAPESPAPVMALVSHT